MRWRHLVVAVVLLTGPAVPVAARDAPDERLIPVLQVGAVTNAVTTTDGRVFVGFPHLDGGAGVRVAEVKSGRLTPYPDNAWNAWTTGKDADRAFVGFNAMRIGPDGNLWVVDTGAPKFGGDILPGGPKIVVIDVGANRVIRTYPLRGVTGARSHVDDIRFNGRMGYVTDAGVPGLIVLDLPTGKARRVLDGDRSTTAERAIHAEGKVLTGTDGREVRIHADQLEVSPDGRHLYYQPASGPMYRIETRWLNDPSIPAAEVARHAERWVDTPSTGGTAIDADGNIYLSDVNDLRILKITPDRRVTMLIEDPRLLWADAMWIDESGFLWIPAAQLNRIAPFQRGRSRVHLPIHVYKMRIGARPPAGDHGARSPAPS
jgi:sugar lactone lactonase YvrE